MRKWLILLLGVVLVGIFWNYQQAGYLDPPSAADYTRGTYARGTVVYNDINDIYSEFNGSISDTNLASNADIDGSKLLDGSIDYDKFANATIDTGALTTKFAHDILDSQHLLHILPQEVFTTSVVESSFTANSIKKAHLESHIPYFAAGSASKKVAYGDIYLHYPDHGLAAVDLEDTVLADSFWTQYIAFGDSSDVGDPSFAAAPKYVTLSPLHSESDPAYFNEAGDIKQRQIIGQLDYHIVHLAAAGCTVHFHNASSCTTAVKGYKVFWEARE